jgi:hypothetical protein
MSAVHGSGRIGRLSLADGELTPTTPSTAKKRKQRNPSMADTEQEVADLRRDWGSAYRITWHDRFRATHVVTGDSLDADSAAELHVLLLAHFSQTIAGQSH